MKKIIIAIRNWLVESGIVGSCLLSHDELIGLIDAGVIDAPYSAVNGSSIDITLHHIIRKEVMGSNMKRVQLCKGDSIETEEVDMAALGRYTLIPDAVILAANNERLNLPANITAQYVMKSSMGRNFLSHQFSGFIDPWFHGILTLELKNENQFHKLDLEPGMKIGQICFFRHRSVPFDKGYAANGRYNGCDKVTPSKGIV
jgi:deoxycytidine triphosphate deaminase